MSEIDIVYTDTDGQCTHHSFSKLIDSVTSLDVENMLELDRLKQFATLHFMLQHSKVPLLYDKNVVGQQMVVDMPSDASVVLFTSGTTADATALIKDSTNIESELDSLCRLFANDKIERVVSTVPFIHIYGFLNALLLPCRLGCEVVIRERFWPQDLLKIESDKRTLVVTTPVYIKSMLKLKREVDLTHVLFLSSTSTLKSDEISEFMSRYNTEVIQLFGSTETGGIASMRGACDVWRVLDSVSVSQDERGCLVVNSTSVSKYIINKRVELLSKPFVTTDIVELKDGGFSLKGRVSEIIKISGKRVSVVALEAALEQHSSIDEALVEINRDSSKLKDESLQISIVTSLVVRSKEISKIFLNQYPDINIEFKLNHVDKIAKNHLGKKLRKQL